MDSKDIYQIVQDAGGKYYEFTGPDEQKVIITFGTKENLLYIMRAK